jgi:2-polyprenyl-6-methoxyphenol hydroxylase-like FAD-dependent oxidoreductase
MGMKKILIIGLGPAGLAAATHAANNGWEVFGFERHPEPTRESGTDQRGFAFTINHSVLYNDLPESLFNSLRPICHPICKRVFVYPDGHQRVYPYGSETGDKLHAISRLDFLLHAKKAALDAGAVLSYNTAVTNVNPLEGTVSYRKNGQDEQSKGDLILGGDGAFGIARDRISAISGSSYSVTFDGVRYVTVTLTEKEIAALTNIPIGLHFFISPEGTDVFIPTPPKGTLLIMSSLLPGMGSLTANDAPVIAHSRNKTVLKAIPDLSERLVGRPIGHFVTTSMDVPYAGSCVLVGDAWRAMPAYAGQGVNAALRDVGDLFRTLKSSETIKAALTRFTEYRQKERQYLNVLNHEVGSQLLRGEYGNWKWRAKENVRSIFKWRSSYQKMAFDPSRILQSSRSA